MASGLNDRNGPHAYTGINFPSRELKPKRGQRVDGSSVTGRNDAPSLLVIERTRMVPISVPMAAASKPFKLGKEAPTWVPDDKAPSCKLCGESFNVFTRRHHCRACGMVFCADCSDKRLQLAHLQNNEARVCRTCHKHLSLDDTGSMGAGVVKPEANGQGFSIRINTSGMSRNNQRTQQTTLSPRQGESMSCEDCAVQFSAFKRKKSCKDCARNFCSACTVQVNSGNNSSPREQQCKKCQILLAGNFTRSVLLNWKIKDLKALLNKQNVNTSKCKEKNDLIDLLFKYYGGNPNLQRRGTEHERLVEQLAERMRQEEQSENQSSRTQNRPSVSTDNPSEVQPQQPPPGVTTEEPRQEDSRTDLDAERLRLRQEREMEEAMARRREKEEQEKREALPENPHLKLDDIQSEAEIDTLNIKSLKRVLLNNFVDYKGCCERWELQERLKRLWKDNEANKKKADEQRNVSDDPSVATSSSSTGEDDLCKICMDSVIDCVLLECGHMATCTKCGKQLAECPICRQYVVRAVHTFKA